MLKISCSNPQSKMVKSRKYKHAMTIRIKTSSMLSAAAWILQSLEKD